MLQEQPDGQLQIQQKGSMQCKIHRNSTNIKVKNRYFLQDRADDRCLGIGQTE